MKKITLNEEQGLQQLRECEEKIEAHNQTRYPAQYAWLRIEIEELWRFNPEPCESFGEYVQKKGYDKSYISRLTRVIRFCDAMQIPPPLMPSESALRPLMKCCFTDDERARIYLAACQKARINSDCSGSLVCAAHEEKCSGGRAVANGNDEEKEEKEEEEEEESDCEKMGVFAAPARSIDIKPSAQDIREAISDFSGTDQIILRAIEERVGFEVSLGEIMQRFTSKIDSLETLFLVVNDYVKAKGIDVEQDGIQEVWNVADGITAAFHEKINKILGLENNKLEENDVIAPTAKEENAKKENADM